MLNVGQFRFQSCSQFCIYCPTPFQPLLYFNGVWVSDNRVAYAIQNETLVLNISNATTSDFGVYEIVLVYCRTYVGLWCFPDYFWYVSWYISLQQIESFTVQQYGKRVISLSLSYLPHTSSTSGLPTSCTTTLQP